MTGMHDDERRWERELRSLNRRRLYEVFAPLDADERLPRELLMVPRREAGVSRRHVAGLLWPLAFLATLGIVVWAGGSVPAALAAVALLFGAFWLYARSGRR